MPADNDNHMTGLLGAAMLLCERRDEIAGTVKLIFQPAEEIVSGRRFPEECFIPDIWTCGSCIRTSCMAGISRTERSA